MARRNPFRSEAEAFRLVLLTIAGFALIVAAALLGGWIAGLAVATIRAFRGHYTAAHHHGVEIPGIYWHFVDVMWIVVYSTVYLL